MMEKNEGWRM